MCQHPNSALYFSVLPLRSNEMQKPLWIWVLESHLLFPYDSWAVALYLSAASLALCASLEPITTSCLKHHLRAKPSPIPPVPPTIPILIILEIVPVKILSFSN